MSQILKERPVPAAAQSLSAIQASPATRIRSLLRWGLRALFLVGILFAGFLAWVWSTCFAEPPALEGVQPVVSETLRVDEGGRRHFGHSWFEERPGHSIMYLEGDPYALGYANARLTDEWVGSQEEDLMKTVRGFFPGELGFWGITLLVLVNNRSLPDHVREEYQLEVRGLADGSTDPFPQFGPRYHRMLNYHAAHDISHWVWDKPVVGCTAFAAKGTWTSSGDMIIGRNFDFEAGRLFDENKIIGLYRPDEGLAFLSVSWPGMAGAVTGINAERVFCSVNGAHSVDKGRIGTPVSLVVREVLQYARSLDEAIEIVDSAEVFVSDSYLLADGETGEAAVVEKTPGRAAVRRIRNDVILQANHFLSEELALDPGNQEYLAIGTSSARYARLEELVAGARGTLDVAGAVEILRDREAADGRSLCAGNRSAINAMIATHAVVANATTGELWVSRGPHQLGEFDRYSIDNFGQESPSLPADPALTDGTYRDLVEGRRLLEVTRELAETNGLDRGLVVLSAREGLERVPADPDLLRLLGEAYEELGQQGLALEAYRAALAAHPPFAPDREVLASAVARIRGEGD
jgi:isopenicillin-N N-acyltransferase-like protein